MNEDRYLEIENTSDYKTFTFISSGRKGDLLKIINFNPIAEFDNVFNLALGTVLPNGEIDFETVTNNGDRNKILVTITDIVLRYVERYPERNVYFTGSDRRRTLLYQRAISYGYDELIEEFNIFGDISIGSRLNEFEPFDRTKIYAGFLIGKK